MITLLGALLGFLGSAFPEFLKIYKDKKDREHELILLDMQMKQQREGFSQRLEEIGVQADIAESAALYKTYTTGITWVDALNGTVRPVIAYAFFVLYATVKFISYAALPEVGVPFVVVYDTLWTQDDAAIFAGIISFYFGQRAMSKIKQG